MNDDFESRFARVLNEQVDVRLGPRQAAPPFDPARPLPVEGTPRRGPWLLPLIAAAVVAGVVGATVTATHLLSDGRPVDPATRLPSTTSTTKSATGIHTVSLGAARISLPAGWLARDLQRYADPGGSFALPGWCLTPAGVPVSSKPDACPVVLLAGGNTQSLDVDIEGGLTANPEYCFQGTKLDGHTEQTGDKQFGGRSADWRHWTIACKGGSTYDIEQYVVATGPAYILYSQHSDRRYHPALTEIAANSTLPAQRLPVRLMDRGIVRELTRTSDGYRLRLDRIIEGVDNALNENPATYDYVVPTSIIDRPQNNGPIRVGSTVSLWTDGHVVTELYSN